MLVVVFEVAEGVVVVVAVVDSVGLDHHEEHVRFDPKQCQQR